jgi:hypothetical protein
MNLRYQFGLLAALSLLAACDKGQVPEKLPDDPKHVWSDQQDAYYQAKAVAEDVNTQQRQKEQRLEELGVVPRRSAGD